MSIANPVNPTTLDQVRLLPAGLVSDRAFSAALQSLRDSGTASFEGAWGASSALLAASMLQQCAGTLLVVCPATDAIDKVCDDLNLFSAEPAYRFPAWENEQVERSLDEDVYGERLRSLKAMQRSGQSSDRRLLVTSIEALMQPVPSPATLKRDSRHLQVGDHIEIETFRRWLVEERLHQTTAVELPGEFSVRGGLLDLFAPDWQEPVRVELFGDEIVSLRRFDVATQRSLGSLDTIRITMLGSSNDAQAHLCEHLVDGSWVLLIEPELAQEQSRKFLERLERPENVHAFQDVLQECGRFPVASAAGIGQGQSATSYSLAAESVERFSGEVGRVCEDLERISDHDTVYLVATTEAEIHRLEELMSGTQLATGGRLHSVIGFLSEGFRLPKLKTLLISANEVFRRTAPRRITRRLQGKAIDSFLELREGDLVVHLSHGIGRYRGTELLDKLGNVEEHLRIEFAGGAKLYVPATKIDLVQKYVGGTKRRPSLAKLGNTTWSRQKQAAEAAVRDMAAELLELQAARMSRPGIAVAVDGPWQQEFDASFPYQETSDQLLAIREIKHDMQSSQPMDRLLCGDVGFGKTELAMRAAFKAVDNGYQVAVLVPTTILAEQHFHTFTERMAEYPFDISRLSRFCSGKEQKETLAGLRDGRIDIVIGTHRLASKDVQFHNLGLLIIDEEQRFGVEVKERLKLLRTTVDILTMTATPIPRTLHMSLVGVRDISNLETAPEDRVAIETRVTRFDRELIRRAVMRELNRGGQVFFVHNRVQDIEVVAKKLRQIVPEASLAIGHGQMHEDQLEAVMVDFVAHRFDILLATTIVESGLDIPNANTIFIDEAGRYGLADLHQLRGRVGRYKHRAYCYMLIDANKHLSPNAAKRLRAIEEFSEMGAGFAISMRDLEIRGAGNLLGHQQSGHIAAVGYEFYCQLLEKAVRTLKKMPRTLAAEIDVDIDLPGEAFLPDDYIFDMRLKIDLYRRLRRAASFDEMSEFRAELIDRFGELPPPASRLLALAELRLELAVWQIAAVYVEDKYLVFQFSAAHRAKELARKSSCKLRVVDDHHAYLPPISVKQTKSPPDYLSMVKSVLQPTESSL